MTRFLVAAGVFRVAVALSTIPGNAGAAETETAHSKTPEPYAPGLGDFMTAYVQPHHIKLWQAGSAENWPLAAYEANELRETFEDVATYQATWHDLPVAKMVEAMLEPKLAAVDQAIEKRDAATFGRTYEQLTASCNNCHRLAKHEFIVIQVPSGSAFPDQSFKPR